MEITFTNDIFGVQERDAYLESRNHNTSNQYWDIITYDEPVEIETGWDRFKSKASSFWSKTKAIIKEVAPIILICFTLISKFKGSSSGGKLAFA